MRTDRKTVLALAAVVAVLAAGGCSSASKTTCDQYAGMSNSKQTSTVNDMIENHGLNPASNALGAASVQSDVDQYCGYNMLVGGGATKNNSEAIENAVDWASYTKD